MPEQPTDTGKPVTRRRFVTTGAVLAGSGLSLPCFAAPQDVLRLVPPVVISTWPFGKRANETGMAVLAETDSPLDAVEAGVKVIEKDPKVSSVGYGGTPNREGVVELDASIMRGKDLGCGAVAALQNILHPISVARKVMEETDHVLLVGEGALRFAREQGFKEQDLLTEGSRKRWEALKAREAGKGDEAGKGNQGSSEDDHDTIGMIALNRKGTLAAAVTTSGLGYKLPGRVGDSPLIGCGIYADDRTGAVVSTGLGEEAIRVLGAFLTVELMRQGMGPMEAVMETLKRVRDANRERRGPFQLAFLAMTPDGRVAGGALQKGFSFAYRDGEGREALVKGAVLP